MHYVYEYSLSHKKMQLSEILLEYVKTKCDDLNLFVGIAIVQIYIYIYISHFLVFAPGPRPSCALALCRGSRSAGQPPSSSPRPRRSRRARGWRRWFLWLPPVQRRWDDLAAFQKGQPGRTLKKCSIWWSFSCWLVVTGTMEFYDFPYFLNSHPNWLIFFRGVETTN